VSRNLAATHIIYSGAGKPEPFDSDGKPVVKHPITDVCSHCGDPHAEYRLREAISDNFTTVKNASRAWPYKTDRLCAACIFAAKTLALKCSLWFARENGIWFVSVRPSTGFGDTRPDVLEVLLNPPEPPFVAGFGLYGVDHGGEANLHRCWWPDGYRRDDVLSKLQAKHTAIYARTAFSRERYHLQINDVDDCTVNVKLWGELKKICMCILVDLRVGGVGAMDCRAALVTLRPPPRCPMNLLARWGAIVAPLQAYHGAPWWELFVGLLLIPELVITNGINGNTGNNDKLRRRPDPLRAGGDTNETLVCVPVASNQDANEPRKDRAKSLQQSLF